MKRSRVLLPICVICGKQGIHLQMKILAITNLYPRPDQPHRGLFNLQFFDALRQHGAGVTAVVLVPEWRPWRWQVIRRWDGAENGPRMTQMNADESRNSFLNLRQSASSAGSSSSPLFLPVPHLPLFGRNLAWRFHVRALRRYRGLFESSDVVLATWLYPDAVAAGTVARECGKPYWIKVHGTDRFHIEHPVRRRPILDIAAHAAGFLPNARFLADYLADHGVSRDKIHVIRHGIDHTRFHPRSKDEAMKLLKDFFPQMTQINADDRIILCVGNLQPIKGPDRLLEAFALHLRESASSAGKSHLVFLGSGPMRNSIEKASVRLGIADHVHFLGSRSPDEVALWMNVADCLCLPSRSEGMPNVVLEALASGLPVAATDVGDVRNVLRDEAGCVVRDARPDSMARALNDVLGRDWDRAAIAATVADLTWPAAAGQALELFRGSIAP